MLHPKLKFLPTHLCIGAKKSATSWIWKQLQNHPQVCTSKTKEIHFFNFNYHLGMQWYRNQFEIKPNGKFFIDMTPDYLHNESCPKIIKETIPDAKIFVSLRNPIERAFSHWRFGKFIDNTKDDFFIDSWNKNWNKIRDMGLYEKNIQNYLNFYQLDLNIKVFFYDDIKKNSENFVIELYDYIGLENSYRSEYFKKKWMPGSEEVWIKFGEKNRIESYKEWVNSKFSMDDKVFNLLRDFYEPTIKKMENIFKRDFSNWLDRSKIDI